MLNVIFLSQFFSCTNGEEESVFQTCRKTSKNDHNVWVITNQVKNEKYQENEFLKVIKVKPELEYEGGLPPSFSDKICN